MSRPIQSCLLIIPLVGFVLNDACLAPAQNAENDAAHRGPECLAADNFFADEVWVKVGERTCLKCHNAKGDASDSEFLLRDTSDQAKRKESLRKRKTASRCCSPKSSAGSMMLSSSN